MFSLIVEHRHPLSGAIQFPSISRCCRLPLASARSDGRFVWPRISAAVVVCLFVCLFVSFDSCVAIAWWLERDFANSIMTHSEAAKRARASPRPRAYRESFVQLSSVFDATGAW